MDDIALRKSPSGSPLRKTTAALRTSLLSRRGMIVAATAAVGGGIALNWGWLTAVGVAPLLLSALPCVAMCGLGLCMRGTGKSCSGETSGKDS